MFQSTFKLSETDYVHVMHSCGAGLWVVDTFSLLISPLPSTPHNFTILAALSVPSL